jgi:S1-C subfamily serine protease
MKSIHLQRAVWLALVLLLAIQSAPADDDAAAPASASKSLLRVNSTNQVYEFFQPWIKKPPFSRRGIGALIDGGRILVTAELVANSTFIELEKPATAEKSTATVERVDYDCNLAVLRPADPAFLSGMQPLALNGPLKVGDEATILQLEPNGDIAQTLGRITSISVAGYPSESGSLLLFKLGAPLQQRDGSFTLPAVRDGRLIGMLMRYDARNQSADIVPTAVIRHFLAEVDSPTYQGFARLGLAFAQLRDPQLRRYIGLKEPGGIYVTDITPRGSADAAGIKKGDVILAVNGLPLDQDGNYEDPDYGRILFSHLTNTIKHPGAVLPLKILRNGQTLEIPVTMQVANPDHAISETHLSDEAPKYVILGGLVFIELSRPYLKEWGSKWASTAPQRLVYYDAFQNELPADRGRIIILSQVLPTPDTIGYEDLENIVVTKVNGQPIKSLADLSEAAKKPVEGFHKIEFEEDPKLLFLDATSIQSNADELKKHYSLPALERL